METYGLLCFGRFNLHGFDVLWEDAHAIVVNKPSGVLTQAPPGIDCLEWRIRRYLQFSTSNVKEPYLGVPHRLDRPVSGAMVFAKTKAAARKLHEQFQQKLVTKRYWALLEGSVVEDHATWHNWMRKIDGESRSELVKADHTEAKEAILHLVVKSRAASFTWVEIELVTGRSHQIRLQSGSRGHAVLGDVQYGSTTMFGDPVDDPRFAPLALHARHLAIHHPIDGQRLIFEAELPKTWSKYIDSALT
jgi:23S rRNA pseudouridine1911/1915/1917 synthase